MAPQSLPLLLLLLLLLASPASCGALPSQRSARWRRAFQADNVVGNYRASLPQVSRIVCAGACLDQEGCLTFAFSAESRSCWLYDYYEEHALSGTPGLATDYHWLVQNGCPEERGYSLVGNSCLKVVDVEKTWSQAREDCLKEGGHLFIAKSADDLIALDLRGTENYWLGGSDFDVEGEWRWEDGSRVTEGWNPGEPDGGVNLNCLALQQGTLWDRPCSSQYLSLCQLP